MSVHQRSAVEPASPSPDEERPGSAELSVRPRNPDASQEGPLSDGAGERLRCAGDATRAFQSRQAQRDKARRRNAASEMAAALERQRAEEKALADVEREKKEEKRQQEKEKRTAAALHKCEARVEAIMRWETDVPVHLFYTLSLPCDRTSDRVARTRETLVRSVLPGRYAEALLVQIERNESLDVVPQWSDAKCAGEFYLTLVYRVQHYATGVLWSEGETEGMPSYLARVPLELFLMAKKRNLCSTMEFGTTLRRVEAHLAAQFDYFHDQYLGGVDTPQMRHLFTAMLLVDSEAMRGQSGLEDLAKSYIWNKLTGQLARVLPEPVAKGYMIVGYRPNYGEIFKSLEVVPPIVRRAGVSLKPHMTAALERMRLRYARVCDRLYIDGFWPTFPDVYQGLNIQMAAAKRLLCRLEEPSDRAMDYFREVAGWMASKITRAQCVSEVEMRELATQVAHEHGYLPTQQEEFVFGAVDAVLRTEGWTTRLAEAIKHFGSFIKPETYPYENLKVPRFITAPCMYMRGFLFGCVRHAEKQVYLAFPRHHVKGLVPEQIQEKVMTEFSPHAAEGAHVMETDYSAMECHNRPTANGNIRDEVELPVLQAGAPPNVRASLDHVFHLLARMDPVFRGFFYTVFGRPITASGEYTTAVGNWILNFDFTSTCKLLVHRIPIERVRDYLDSDREPKLFEGDDGLFVDQTASPQEYAVAAKECGIALKMEAARHWYEASFCGNTVQMVSDLCDTISVTLKEPLEALSRVFCRLGVNQDAHTTKRDFPILVSKARSYFIGYPHLPILAPVCHAILQRYGDQDRDIRDELAHFLDDPSQWSAKLSPAARDVIRRFGNDLNKVYLYVSALPPSFGDCQVSEQLREAMAKKWSHLTSSFQRLVESELVGQILDGQQVLRCETLRQLWTSYSSAKRMICVQVDGIREDVSKARDALVQLSSSEKVMSLSRMFDFASLIPLMSMGATCLSAVVWVLGLVGPYFFPLLMGAGLVGVPILMGVYCFFAWLLLGYRPRDSLRPVHWIFRVLGLLFVISFTVWWARFFLKVARGWRRVRNVFRVDPLKSETLCPTPCNSPDEVSQQAEPVRKGFARIRDGLRDARLKFTAFSSK